MNTIIHFSPIKNKLNMLCHRIYARLEPNSTDVPGRPRDVRRGLRRRLAGQRLRGGVPRPARGVRAGMCHIVGMDPTRAV